MVVKRNQDSAEYHAGVTGAATDTSANRLGHDDWGIGWFGSWPESGWLLQPKIQRICIHRHLRKWCF